MILGDGNASALKSQGRQDMAHPSKRARATSGQPRAANRRRDGRLARDGPQRLAGTAMRSISIRAYSSCGGQNRSRNRSNDPLSAANAAKRVRIGRRFRCSYFISIARDVVSAPSDEKLSDEPKTNCAGSSAAAWLESAAPNLTDPNSMTNYDRHATTASYECGRKERHHDFPN